MANEIRFIFRSDGLSALKRDLSSIAPLLKGIQQSAIQSAQASTRASQQQTQATQQQVQTIGQVARAQQQLAVSLRGNQSAIDAVNRAFGSNAQSANQAITAYRQFQKQGVDSANIQQQLARNLGLTQSQFTAVDNAVRRSAQTQQTAAQAARGFSQELRNVGQLANSLGTNFTGAQKLAQSLGLTSAQALQLVRSLQQLQQAGATTQQRFNSVNQGLGVTAAQFNKAEQAISQFNARQAQIAQGAAAISQLSGRAAEAARGYQNLGRSLLELDGAQDAIRNIGLATGALAAGIGAIGAKATQTFLEFDKAIRTFGVVTESTGTEQLGKLRAEVERLGATTSKTPQDIANLSIELGRAGFSAEQTTQALSGVVLASQATGEDLQRIGEVIGSTINQFQLTAADSTQIADLLTATSNASAAGANDLGEALSYVGSQANQSGQSLRVTLELLGALANAGIKGSSAGTGLAEALRRIKIVSAGAETEFEGVARTSIKAQKAFRVLNADVRDANGGLKPFPEVLKIVQANLEGLSKGDRDVLLDTLFGVQGGRVVATLIGSNAEQLGTLQRALDNAGGSAQRAGVELQKGLAASLTQLQAATAVAFNRIGEVVGAGLEPLIRASTALIGGFTQLPAPIQNALIGVTAFVGALSAGIAVVSAFQAVNLLATTTFAGQAAALVANNTGLVLNNAAKIALTLTTTQFTAAQVAANAATLASTLASGSAAAATGVLTGAVGALGATLTTVLPLVAAATIAFVGLQVAKNVRQLTLTNQELEEFGNQANASGQQAINFANKLNAINDARKNGQKFSDEEIKKQKQLLELGKQQIADLELQLKNAKDIVPANEEQAAAQAGLIKNLETSISVLKSQTGELEKGIVAQAANTSETEKGAKANKKAVQSSQDRKKALEAEVEALKARQEAEKQRAEDAFRDTQQGQQDEFDEQKRQREKALAVEIAAIEEASQKRQQAAQKLLQDEVERRQQANQTVLNDRQKAFDQTQQIFKEEGQRRIQELERSFNATQRAEEQAFRKGLEAERTAANAGFDAQQQQIDRTLQLENAKTAEERKRLEEQFANEDRLAARRAELEAPLRAAREAFEEQIRLKEEAFQAQQDAKKLEFEQNVLQPARQALEAELEQRKVDFETNILNPLKKAQEEELTAFKEAEEAKIAEIKKQTEEQVARLKKQFEDAEREKQRAFQKDQEAAERAFREQQRVLDKQNAEAVKKILESTKIPSPEIPQGNGNGNNPPPIPQLRSGGAVEAGKPYIVGDAPGGRITPHTELFVPDTSGYVMAAQRFRQLLKESQPVFAPNLQIPSTAPSPISSPDLGDQRMLKSLIGEVKGMKLALLEELRSKRTPQFNFSQLPQQGTAEFSQLRSMLRGML